MISCASFSASRAYRVVAGVMVDGRREESDLGTPQGGVISPLLANIYLQPLDLWWEKTMRGTAIVRYADDIVVLCPKGSAESVAIERMPA
jgi:RNA-directed DNA polymerase